MNTESNKFNILNTREVKLIKKIICSILLIIILLVDLPLNVFAAEIENANSNEIVAEEIEKTEMVEETEETEEPAEKTIDTNDLNEEVNENIELTAPEKQEEQQVVEEVKEEIESPNTENQTENSENINAVQNKETEANNIPQAKPASTPKKAMLLTSAPNDEDGTFKVALRWGGTSNTEYNWNATKSEDRIIKLTFYYQNEVTSKAYEPGDLVVTIPGIGKLNRNSTLRAFDVAADLYGATELKRDWSYQYNSQTDTYTFYNNHAIEKGATFNGSFEMLYQFNSRKSINEYTQTLKAQLTDGEQIADSQELSINFTSLRDTFYINKTAQTVVSADGLNKFVEEGKTVADYGWVKYTFRYNVLNLNARGLKTRYMTDILPAGCVIATDANVTRNEDGTITYLIPETSVSENSVREYSIIVGYPEEYIGQTVTNTAYLLGVYLDEEDVAELASSSVELATSSVDVTIVRIQNQIIGIVPGKSMSPDYVYENALQNDINFSARLQASAIINQEDEGYSIAITDDYMEILTDAGYSQLTDDEYNFTKITVPGKSNFSNANGYTIEDGEYQIKLYALYKENAISSRALENYTLVYDGMWGDSSYTQNLEKDAVAVRAELTGLTESIKSFYITAGGTINISENVENETYINPTRIVNYAFTEFKDKNGNSLISEITRENYTQDRIYDIDYALYGKGQYRTSDYILIREEPRTTSYYYARATIDKFGIDENVEYFITKLTHTLDINNIDGDYINSIELYGVTGVEELETLIDTLEFTYSDLKFKYLLSVDVDMQDYLLERATITKEGKEIGIIFDFSDNPIVSTRFTLGYTVDARLNYEDYYDSTNPTYSIATYGYVNEENLYPQSVETYKNKTMATARDSESILLALASHQQLIKMVKTLYTGDFVQEDAVTPMNDVYTYRLKLRNGYNTLLNTEFIDILEHAELTQVDGEYPYQASEWFGTFKNVDTTYIEAAGHTVQVYYANSLNPASTDWVLMENYANGIWTTTEVNEANVKAIKVEIDGEIIENSITYVDVNMTAPENTNLIDKKAYNTYQINCNAIDLYTGLQSTYMRNMPSNVVDVRLVEKEYEIVITKSDATSGGVLSGVQFGIYDVDGNKVDAVVTNLLGVTIIKGLKVGTYTLKEEVVPAGYKEIASATLVINADGAYSFESSCIYEVTEQLNFTSTGAYGWVQNADGTWQSDNYKKGNSTAIMQSREFELPTNGTISFEWSVSSESVSCDYLYYTIKNVTTGSTVNGGTSIKIGGTEYGTVYESLQFNTVTQELQPGRYVIEFVYDKDGSVNKGLDRGFVKNVSIDYKEIITQTGEGQNEIIGNIPTINLNITNTRAKGSITVHKIDEYLNVSGEEIPLQEVVFDLYDVEENLIDTQITDELGNAKFRDLDWGKVYVIKERESLSAYELAEFTNVYLGRLDKDTTVTIKNNRKKGTAELTKQDEIDGTKLEGATYGLYAENDIYDKDANILYEKDTLIKDGQTNNEGKVSFDNIIWGDYYIKEIKSVYGYELSAQKYIFTINSETVENVIEITENEKRSKANLQLIKIDQDGSFLPGVEFSLYKEDGSEATYNEQIDIEFTSNSEYGWSQNADGIWQSENYNIHNTTAIMQSQEIEIANRGILSFEWSVSSQSASSDYVYYTIKDAETGDVVIGEIDTKIGGTTYGTVYNSLQFNSVEQILEEGKYVIEFAYKKNATTTTRIGSRFCKEY